MHTSNMCLSYYVHIHKLSYGPKYFHLYGVLVEQRLVDDIQNYKNVSFHFKALSGGVFTTCSCTN